MGSLSSIQTLWAVVVLIGTILFIAFEFLPLLLGEWRGHRDNKRLDTQAAKMAKFNAALGHEGEMSKLHGPNSQEVMEAKKVSMQLWKEVIGKGLT